MVSKETLNKFKMSKVFYSLGSIIAIVPPKGVADQNFRYSSNYEWYCMLVVCSITVSYGFSIMGRINEVYKHFPTTTLVITDFVFSLTLTVSTLLSIILPSLWYSSKYKTFLINFSKIDKFLYKNEIANSSRRLFGILFILGHIILIILFAYDGYVWTTKVGLATYQYYIVRIVQSYYSYITVIIISSFANCLQFRFQSVNKLLKTIRNATYSEENVNSVHELHIRLVSSHNWGNLRQLAKIYGLLGQQVKLFNTLFGWQFFLLTAVILTGLLNCIDVLMVHVVKNDYPGDSFGLELIILNCCWSLVQMVLGTIVAASCDGAAKESARTGEICYKLLLNLPPVPEKLQDRALREQLHLLAQLSTSRCPTFSAAGFFKVDYSMLLALFGSVTSYVIVVIQFNK